MIGVDPLGRRRVNSVADSLEDEAEDGPKLWARNPKEIKKNGTLTPINKNASKDLLWTNCEISLPNPEIAICLEHLYT